MVSLCAQTVRSPDCHTVQCWCFNWGLLLQSIFMNLESSVFSTGPAHLVTVVDISLPAISWPPFPLSSWHRTSQTLSIVSCPDFISLYFVDDIWVCALNFVFCFWNSVPGPDMVATLDWLVTSGGGQSRWGPTTPIGTWLTVWPGAPILRNKKISTWLRVSWPGASAFQ